LSNLILSLSNLILSLSNLILSLSKDRPRLFPHPSPHRVATETSYPGALGLRPGPPKGAGKPSSCGETRKGQSSGRSFDKLRMRFDKLRMRFDKLRMRFDKLRMRFDELSCLYKR
jgi:hypothetical protein